MRSPASRAKGTPAPCMSKNARLQVIVGRLSDTSQQPQQNVLAMGFNEKGLARASNILLSGLDCIYEQSASGSSYD